MSLSLLPHESTHKENAQNCNAVYVCLIFHVCASWNQNKIRGAYAGATFKTLRVHFDAGKYTSSLPFLSGIV